MLLHVFPHYSLTQRGDGTEGASPLVATQPTYIGQSPDSPPFTRQYSYEELDHEPRRAYSPTGHGFSYDGGKENMDGSEGNEKQEGHVKRGKAQAFNYSPGEIGSTGLATSPVIKKGNSEKGNDSNTNSFSAQSSGAMPETSVDEGGVSGLDTSIDSSGMLKKQKDKKKGKKDGLTKEERKKLKLQKAAEKKAKKEQKKKKKGKFGLFGRKKKQQEETSSSSSDSSTDSDSSSDSESDDSVIQEAREGAQPGDLDASLAESERKMRDSRNSEVDRSITEYNAAAGVQGGIDIEGVPKMLRTTTQKTTVSSGGEVTESSIERHENVNTGEVNVSTSLQTKVRFITLAILWNI